MKRFTIFVGMMLLASTALAAVPQLISIQGNLRDGSGNPVANGSYSVIFTIYDASSGGTVFWAETTSVSTNGGLFTTLLGADNPLPDSVFNDSSRYLGVKVGADPEMTPRQKMSSVGFSYRSSEWTSVGQDVSRVNGNVGIGSAASVGRKLYVYNPGSELTDLEGIRGAADNSSSGGARGIYGIGTSNTGDAYGGYFYGFSLTGNSFGVYGTGNTYGVYGSSFANTGVYGNSTSGDGVHGYSASGYGVRGSSPSGSGVYAEGGPFGVYAIGGTAGVDGYSTSGTGVHGSSVNSYGVWAQSTFGYGLYATGGPNGVVASANSGDGVSATGTGNGVLATGGVRGVYATGSSYGIVGVASANNGAGVYGSNGGNALTYAGYFVGTLYVAGTAGNNTGVWSYLSDKRLKKEIEPIQNALETVEQLQPVSFRWKDEKKDAEFGRVRGLIAQDVEKVIPEWIKTDPDGYKRIEPIGVDALLIEAIKELKAENDDLRERILKLGRGKPQAHVE